MKKTAINLPEGTTEISKSRFANWHVYAAAAGATLAMSANADAGIITGTLNKSLTAPGNSSRLSVSFLLPNGAHSVTEHLVLQKSTANRSGYAKVSGGIEFATAHTARENASNKTIGGGRLAKNFGSGSVIGTAPAGNGATFLQHRTTTSGNKHVMGAFLGPLSTAFVGFATGFNGHFGWLKIKIANSTDGYAGELDAISFGLQTDGSPIKAGDTGGPATPEPGTAGLALLAMGATGILAWRLRRKELAA